MSGGPSYSGPRLCVDFGTALSKVVIAQPAADGAVDIGSVRPLALGRTIGEANPLLASCAIFVDDQRLLFAAAALRAAERKVDEKREPLSSFKAIMGAPDLADAIESLPAKEIDPSGRFRRRDLIVLFLAWLLILVDNEIGADEARTLPLRYTRPDWSPQRGSQADLITARLFDEARAVADRLGLALVAEDGLNVDDALDATHAARSLEFSRSIVEGGVLEAVAAAACHLSPENRAKHLLVFDMGAGTTDIAALTLPDYEGEGPTEIVEARQTLPIGGDIIDKLLLDVFVGRARNVRGAEAQARLWRSAALSARTCKEQIFAEGRAAIVYEGRAVTAKLSDITNDREFKDILENLRAAYSDSLDALAAQAERDGAKEINVVLAGGGANLSALQDLVRRTKPSRSRIKPIVLPPTPDWANASNFRGNLAPIFPQLAIAIGGAAAPRGLLR